MGALFCSSSSNSYTAIFLKDLTGYDVIYINPDLTPEQLELEFETRNELRQLRQSNPLKLCCIKTGRIVENPQQKD